MLRTLSVYCTYHRHNSSNKVHNGTIVITSQQFIAF